MNPFPIQQITELLITERMALILRFNQQLKLLFDPIHSDSTIVLYGTGEKSFKRKGAPATSQILIPDGSTDSGDVYTHRLTQLGLIHRAQICRSVQKECLLTCDKFLGKTQ